MSKVSSEEERSKISKQAKSDITEVSKPENGIRSKRRKRPRQMFSPDDDSQLSRRKQKKPKRFPFSSTAPDRPCDILQDGTPFCCDLCKSRYVINRFSKKSLKNRRSKHVPAPKQKYDPVKQKMLLLCNACGLTLDRPKKTKNAGSVSNEQERDKYIKEAKTWAKQLADQYDLPNAIHLYCPVIKRKKCACLQIYIEANGVEAEKQKRASQLSAMASEARRLSALKCYDKYVAETQKTPEKTSENSPEKQQDNNPENNSDQNSDNSPSKKLKRNVIIGLGNGHKKSEKFTEFVLLNRENLKRKLQLCERATQKILCYSNNFLHKKLKTEEKRFRALPVKGKARLGLLQSFDDLAKKRCCVDNCVMMALTHRTILEEWRRRARQGQLEARRVIAEMLTPTACARKNCYTFVTAVTGCSRTTIVQVNQQMAQTNGDREPPTHGLKKYHHKSKKKEQSKAVASMETAVTEIQTNVVDKQREQLQQLQVQLHEQQIQLQQQQELQHQLLQQTLSSQGKSQTDNVNLLQQINNQLNMQIQNTQKNLQQTLHNMGLLIGTSTTGNQDKTTICSHDIQNKTGTSSNINLSSGNIILTPAQELSININAEQARIKSNVQKKQSKILKSLVETNLAQGQTVIVTSSNSSQSSQVLFTPAGVTVIPQNNISHQSQNEGIPAQQNIIQNPQQIIQAPQNIIPTSHPMIPTQQQMMQRQQNIVLTQPNYQFGQMSSQSDENVITIQPNTVNIAAQHQTAEEIIMNPILDNGGNRIYNFTLPIQGAGNQQIISLENMPVDKVSEVLSNAQVVEMSLPSFLESAKKCGPVQTGSTFVTEVNRDKSLQSNKIFKSNLRRKPNTGKTSATNNLSSSKTAAVQKQLYTNTQVNANLSDQELSPPNMTIFTNNGETSNEMPCIPDIVLKEFARASHLTNVNNPTMYTAAPLVSQFTANKYNNQLENRNPFISGNIPTEVMGIGQTVTDDLSIECDNNPSGRIIDQLSVKPVSKSTKSQRSRNSNINSSQNVSVSQTVSQGHNPTTYHMVSSTKTKIPPKTKEHYERQKPMSVPTSTLTSEYMNFSLPLSDVITMYSNQTVGQKVSNTDQTQQLQLTLQINPVSRSSGDNAFGTNTVDLGSLLIMDQNNRSQACVPPKPQIDKKISRKSENIYKSQRSRQDSQSLVIDEDISTEGNMTDTDEEVQDILKTSNKSRKEVNSKTTIEQPVTLAKRTGTLPFQPMERSDTMIIDQSVERSDTIFMNQSVVRSDTAILKPSGTISSFEDIQRSDTIKLPEEPDQLETITIPVRKQKGKKRDNAKKSIDKRKQFVQVNQTTLVSGQPSNCTQTVGTNDQVILTGTNNQHCQAWLQKIINEVKKN
ncbi:uncharacterized protein LOC127729059 [Mytilus californianus]|uniref:uncharacterized protein LOC127729059 n=1 Tax=Mytilus californianus TaxID=6549 RepID=UPI002248206B|nr:uncharacterized protein LOC127729059 [Mytilus californianus]